MLGMLLVNFLGSYSVCPRILRHTHDYCSYADTIMPQFLFAAGFAMRLSLGRRIQNEGRMPWGRAVRRISGLACVAIVWYSICDLSSIVRMFQTEHWLQVLATLGKRNLFQTLLHIAATSLWILPVIAASARVRVLYAVVFAILHILLSWWFNFLWVNSNPAGIDGGPLGFLTWSIPALCGTLACDVVRSSGPASALRLAGWGISAMAIGWLCSFGTVLYDVPAEQVEPLRESRLAADPVVPLAERFRNWNGRIVEPPFVPPPDSAHRKWNYWMMSQRSGSLSYTTFAAGCSLLLFAIFLWVCDQKKLQLGVFRTLGTNSLAAYLLSDVAMWIVSPWITETAGLSVVVAGFLCFFGIVYGICRGLEARKIYIRV
jgi:predicted acyltransferase